MKSTLITLALTAGLFCLARVSRPMTIGELVSLNVNNSCMPSRAACFSDFECCSDICVKGQGSNGSCF